MIVVVCGTLVLMTWILAPYLGVLAGLAGGGTSAALIGVATNFLRRWSDGRPGRRRVK